MAADLVVEGLFPVNCTVLLVIVSGDLASSRSVLVISLLSLRHSLENSCKSFLLKMSDFLISSS